MNKDWDDLFNEYQAREDIKEYNYIQLQCHKNIQHSGYVWFLPYANVSYEKATALEKKFIDKYLRPQVEDESKGDG